MMGLVTDPVGHFHRPAEPPSTAEAFRETIATPASLLSEEIGVVEPSAESSITVEVFRKTRAARTILVSDQVGTVEPSFTAEVSRETRAAPAVTPSNVRPAVEEPRGEKWRVLLANPAVLVLAALVVFAVLGFLLWRSYRNRASNSPVQAMVKVPDQARSIPKDKGSQPGLTTVSETRTSAPKTQNDKRLKPPEQSVAPSPTPKPSPEKQAGGRDNIVLRPPVAISRNIAMANKGGAPPNSAAEMPGSIPGALPNAPPSSVTNIATDIPVAMPKIAAQKVRVSSGVAQGLLVHQVAPKYPALAQQARIQGTVVLQVVIGKDGTVQNLHVLSGHPMLNQAAIDAVRQWRYKPYRVNGEPVEADTQINVNFTLAGG